MVTRSKGSWLKQGPSDFKDNQGKMMNELYICFEPTKLCSAQCETDEAIEINAAYSILANMCKWDISLCCIYSSHSLKINLCTCMQPSLPLNGLQMH